ncbi:MAG: AAC(3) family N-acetyltransferase [Pseudomonadota bacterium]
MTTPIVSEHQLITDLQHLGVRPAGVLMVHSSLSSIGQTEGAAAVIRALLGALGEDGTLVMPAFRESVSQPGLGQEVTEDIRNEALRVSPPFDIDHTPTTSGLIPETFRTWPGVTRSTHPTTSVIAIGPQAEQIVTPHPLAWAMGPGSPFGRMYELDAQQLMIGVGFNRLTMLHYAETELPDGRRKTRFVPVDNDVLAFPDTGDDLNTHFPVIGDLAIARGIPASGKIGNAPSLLIGSRDVVHFASDYLAGAL